MSFLSRFFGSSQERTVTAIDAVSLEVKGRRRKLEIVGEYFHEGELIRIAGPKGPDSVNIPTVAALLPDPSNRHDKNAVEVRIEGRLVGYLNRDQALGYHKFMIEAGYPGRALANIEARIYGGRIEDDYEASYGVAIYLPESIAKVIGFG